AAAKYGLVARASEEAAQECTILWSAEREFIVDKCRGQHATAFRAWDEKSKSRRKRLTNLLVVAERDSDRRAIADRPKFSPQLFIRHAKQGRSGRSRGSNNHRIEVVASVAGRYCPAIVLRDDATRRAGGIDCPAIESRYQPIDELLHAPFKRG